MDPDATVELIFQLAKKVNWIRETEPKSILPTLEATTLKDLRDELREHISDLNDWVRNGGFLPKEWKRVVSMPPEVTRALNN